VLPTEALLSARLAAKLAGALANDPDAARARALVTHWHNGAVGPDERLERCLMAATLARCIGSRAAVSPSQLLSAALVLRSNCFAVLDEWVAAGWTGGAREEVRCGAALYLTASLLNHSCVPNCHASFAAGGALVLRLTDATIASDHHDSAPQLFISYGPQAGAASRATRQAMLLASHAFACACTACAAGSMKTDAAAYGLRCLAAQPGACDGAHACPPPLQIACSACGRPPPDGSAALVAASAQARAAAAALRRAAEAPGCLPAARAAFKQLRGVAHPASRHVAAGWDYLAQALNAAGPQHAAEAAAASERSLALLRDIYPAGALPLAHELAKLAQLHAAAGERAAAAAAAEEAAGLLRGAYGPTHPRLTELASLESRDFE
jgi:hypothetical protein